MGGTQINYAGFNRATMSQRQIGSLVKPSIYLTALSKPELFRLNTIINNQPITIHIKGSAPWQPRNYNREYGGSVMLIDALARSLNIPTVNIGMKIGLNNVITTQQAMGWDKIKIPHVPAMLLGSYSISPYDVTRLYQTIANNGGKIPLSTIDSITDRQGNILYQHHIEPEQVVPAQAAFQTLYAMQQVVERGTGRSLMNNYADLHLAGKTGTTNDARDTWFVGIDGKHVTTVWVGRDDNGDTKLTGASGALHVYQDYLKRANVQPLVLHKPSDIQMVGINTYGGWNCYNPVRNIPVWTDKGQNFCANSLATEEASAEPKTNKSESPMNKQESLWDVLDPPRTIAPIEEAKPAR